MKADDGLTRTILERGGAVRATLVPGLKGAERVAVAGRENRHYRSGQWVLEIYHAPETNPGNLLSRRKTAMLAILIRWMSQIPTPTAGLENPDWEEIV